MKSYSMFLTGFLILFLSTVFLFTGCEKEGKKVLVEVDFDSLDLFDKIKSFEGISVVEITPANFYTRAFQIDLLQPVDHNNPDGAKFTQRIYLMHADEKTPMVFAPSGYGTSATSSQEIGRILKTNCLNVTHRYFPDARPDPLNWEFLTIEQAAADHHRIVQLFKKIYKGKWISSGASKSGLTPLFHKKYYPEDVDATIAYVAPFTFGLKDPKFPLYLSQIGGNECFSRLQKVQLYVLNHRTEMLQFIDNYINSGSKIYSLDRELLLELDIMDYPFTFWQYYKFDCSLIPDTITSSASQVFQHFTSIVPPDNFSDANLSFYEPYVYQAITELGAPGYQTDYLEGYLKKVDTNAYGNPNYELLGPKGVSYNFRNNTIPEIYEWLQNYGDHIIYIYGKNDPWSAGAIEIKESTDALLFMQEGANHSVKIADLDNAVEVYSALERWLDITIPVSARKSIPVEEELAGFRLGVISE